MTLSIVARDPATGQLGVGVFTGFFNVGAIVPFVEPGVGAVATQSVSEAAYGYRILDGLRVGKGVVEAVADARAQDPGEAMRQVGAVAADGTTGGFTGGRCVEAAGSQVGDGFTVQGNMLVAPAVWESCAAAYEAADGDLAERLVAALRAGFEAGGDIRGHQSAALVVGKSAPGANLVDSIQHDLRVDDHPDPVGELARVLSVAKAFGALGDSIDAVLGGDLPTAMQCSDRAIAALPADPNVGWARVAVLALSGRMDEALAFAHRLFEEAPALREFMRRLAASGLMPVPEADLRAVLEA
jgi:uncharacterized Ntn-hydrolase superfamily protein